MRNILFYCVSLVFLFIITVKLKPFFDDLDKKYQYEDDKNTSLENKVKSETNIKSKYKPKIRWGKSFYEIPNYGVLVIFVVLNILFFSIFNIYSFLVTKYNWPKINYRILAYVSLYPVFIYGNFVDILFISLLGFVLLVFDRWGSKNRILSLIAPLFVICAGAYMFYETNFAVISLILIASFLDTFFYIPGWFNLKNKFLDFIISCGFLIVGLFFVVSLSSIILCVANIFIQRRIFSKLRKSFFSNIWSEKPKLETL